MTITLENCKTILACPKVLPLGYILGSGKYWMVLDDIEVMLSNGNTLTIPNGFKTDLASVPRWLWGLESPYGDTIIADIIHDYLYVAHIGTRADADKEFLLWSNILGGNILDNIVRYSMIRIFGQRWWDGKVPYIKE